jgi:hypothetical protein
VTTLVGGGIFGTFPSVVGSSFLATMRDEQQAAESRRVPG